MSSFGLFHHTARMSRRNFTGIIGKEMLWSLFPRPFISCLEKIVIISSAGCVFGTGLIVNGMCVLCYAVYLQHTGCIISHCFYNFNTNPKVYNLFIFHPNSPRFLGLQSCSLHFSASRPQSTRTASSPMQTTFSHGIRSVFFCPQIPNSRSETNTAQIFPQDPSTSKSQSHPSRRPSHTLITSSSRRHDVLIIIKSPL